LFIGLFFLKTMIYSTIFLMIGVGVSLFITKWSYSLALFSILFLFLTYIGVIYVFYPPSLGIDTWRDVNSALITINHGYISGMSNAAYQIPIMPLLYSTLSLVIGISPLYVSALLGALYIFITAVFAFIVSRKLCKKKNNFSSLITVLLVLSTPLISLWSVGFIPQAFALMSFLSFLLVLFTFSGYTVTDTLLVLPILFVMALTHGGSALWILGFFACLIVAKRFKGGKPDGAYYFIKRSFLIMGLVTAFYFTYTIVLSQITGGIKSVLDALVNTITLTQEPSSSLVSNSDPFITALFCYGSLIIGVALAIVAWLDNKHDFGFTGVFKNVVFVYGVIMLAVGFMGTIFLPDACLDRYLGFGSLLLLSILSAEGFTVLLKRGYIGKLFVGALTVLLVMSIGIGAILTPNFNQFNIQSSYSMQSLPDWSESVSIRTIVSHIDTGNILTDSRTGALIPNYIINKYNGNVDLILFYYSTEAGTSKGTVMITKLGAYGLVGDDAFFISNLNKGNLFVYRTGALDKLNLLSNGSEAELVHLLDLKYDKIFFGSVEVFS
jgi:Predicted membrane-associated HD superfamily hydrolase